MNYFATQTAHFWNPFLGCHMVTSGCHHPRRLLQLEVLVEGLNDGVQDLLFWLISVVVEGEANHKFYGPHRNLTFHTEVYADFSVIKATF